jgi:hypothetical protein
MVSGRGEWSASFVPLMCGGTSHNEQCVGEYAKKKKKTKFSQASKWTLGISPSFGGSQSKVQRPRDFIKLDHWIHQNQWDASQVFNKILNHSKLDYHLLNYFIGWSTSRSILAHMMQCFHHTMKKQLSLDIKWHLANSSQLSTIYPDLFFS